MWIHYYLNQPQYAIQLFWLDSQFVATYDHSRWVFCLPQNCYISPSYLVDVTKSSWFLWSGWQLSSSWREASFLQLLQLLSLLLQLLILLLSLLLLKFLLFSHQFFLICHADFRETFRYSNVAGPMLHKAIVNTRHLKRRRERKSEINNVTSVARCMKSGKKRMSYEYNIQRHEN